MYLMNGCVKMAEAHAIIAWLILFEKVDSIHAEVLIKPDPTTDFIEGSNLLVH